MPLGITKQLLSTKLYFFFSSNFFLIRRKKRVTELIGIQTGIFFDFFHYKLKFVGCIGNFNWDDF